MATNVQSVLEASGYYDQIKALSKAHKVAVPEIIGRMVEHVFTSDNSAEVIADLLSDAPKSSRGRKALDPAVKVAREALKSAAKGTSLDTLQAAIDMLRKA